MVASSNHRLFFNFFSDLACALRLCGAVCCPQTRVDRLWTTNAIVAQRSLLCRWSASNCPIIDFLLVGKTTERPQHERTITAPRRLIIGLRTKQVFEPRPPYLEKARAAFPLNQACPNQRNTTQALHARSRQVQAIESGERPRAFAPEAFEFLP